MNKIVAALIIFMLPLSAHASMQDMLQGMFMSNVTPPGAYKSQTRGGFVGGSVELRAPVKAINIAAFDPPRFNAGCGGLDMYGGSFSFINANQFTSLVRQIMSNAIGLMFQAALKSINPMIADLVNYFQDVVNGLNKAAGNTCAIAHKLTDSTFDPDHKTTAAQDSWSSFGASTGMFPDFHDPKYSSPAKQKANARTAESTQGVTNIGNLTWRALQISHAFDKLNFFPVSSTTNGISDDDYKAMMLMSMIGTQVITGATSGVANTGVAGSNISTTNPAGSPPLNPGEKIAVLLLKDMVNEGYAKETMKVYICGPAQASDGLTGGADLATGALGCPIMTETNLAFSGTAPYVANMLYGDPNITDPTTLINNLATFNVGNPAPNSILGLLTAGNTAGLTAAQDTFLRFMPGAFVRILIEAQSDPGSYSQIIPLLENYAAVSMAVQIGEAAEHAGRSAWDGVLGIAKPTIVEKNVDVIHEDLKALIAQRTVLKQVVSIAQGLAETVRKNNPNARVM